jgi:excisionase family DNA binding protein
MDRGETLACLEAIETELLSLVHRVRVLRAELRELIETSPDVEALLDANALAKLLGVETAYLYSLARAGKIPSVKLGKYRRFSPLQVRKWLERKASR